MESNAQTPPTLAFVNEVCPIMGNAVPEENAVYVVYNGMAVAFCCPGCDSGFLDDPVTGLKKINESGGKVSEEALSPEQNPTIIAAENTTCPVLGNPIEDDRDRFSFAIHNGVRVELCCSDCRIEFMKSPDTYLSKAAETGDVPKERLKP
jgi:YHS domain-containing protein